MSSNAALALAEQPGAGSSIVVRSEVLGEVTLPAASVLSFPSGLFGFPECRRFALVPSGRDGMYWLQSLEHSALVFLLADPFIFFDGYSVELGASDRRDLCAQGADDVAVLAIVTLPRGGDAKPTANLQGPVALNMVMGVGRQLAVPDGGWGMRCEFEP